MDSWKFYTKVPLAWKAMLDEMERAEKTIDFEQYTLEDLEDSQIGKKFVEMFEKKAKEGLRVRIILDGVGSWRSIRLSVRQEMLDSGVQLVFHTGAFGKFSSLFKMFFRDHRKLCIVDGKSAFLGGVIISQKAEVWRDSMVRVEGKVVDILQKFFEESLRSVSQSKRSIVSNPLKADQKTTVTAGGPRHSDRYILRQILEQVDKAQEKILITSPYLNPPTVLKDAFLRACRRKVSLEIIVPKASDNFTADLLSYSFFKSFLKMGAKIYLYPSYIHAKSFVIDGKWASFGSANLDHLSLLRNYELNLTSVEESFVEELSEHFGKDKEKSLLLDMNIFKNYSLHFKFLSFFSQLFRHII